MKVGRETRKRMREPVDHGDVQSIESRHMSVRSMESCFEVAHVTWSKRMEQREPVVLGHASEPMS